MFRNNLNRVFTRALGRKRTTSITTITRTLSSTAQVRGLGYIPIDKDQMQEQMSDSNVFVFDVRDQNEVDGGHVQAANFNHIPLEEIDEALMLNAKNFELIYEMKKPDFHDKIIFYCMAGSRAENAALQFKEAGYTRVSVYTGGWKEWTGWNREEWETWSKETGYPLE